jgi:pyruvate dehydrogenase E1 component
VNVINLVSPRRAYEGWRADGAGILAEVIPAGQRAAPILTVHDAASHALAWVGGVFGQPTRSLGVDKFGQSGLREPVYAYVGIGVKDIISAGFACVD